jgi:phosphatidylserine/phosphatidylglycerophosphate/cardiolipin synthase-like enzyme
VLAVTVLLFAASVSTAAVGAGSAPVVGSASAGIDSIPDHGVGFDAPARNASAAPEKPRIVSIYPNPVLDDDAGEFVVLWFPPDTDLAGWTLTDGESTLSLGNATVGGRVALTTDPGAASNLTTYPIVVLDGTLSLANGGDELALAHDNETIDGTNYTDAPDAELFRRVGATWRWVPLGATDVEPVRADGARVRPFVLPDAPSVPLATLRGAEDRILVGGYSFASERVARELERAAARGVEVRVLLDDAPAGGISTAQARVLDSLTGSAVDVEVIGGSYARYDFHHPKYAVVDDRALVMTENWKPAGTGGNASRGWGVVVDSSKTADALATIFRADADWRDTISWQEFRRDRAFTADEAANGSYPAEFEPRSMRAEEMTLLAAPDNAEGEIVRLLDGANESIAVVQASIGSRNQPFLRAALRAARRGVEVRILLSSAWYSEADNEAMVAWLNQRARAEDLPLDAKVADPGDRFAKIHAKGVLVDRETAVIGSVNWNNNSARENREIALVVEGEGVGEYYGRVFDADWEGGDATGDPVGGTDLPIGLVAAVLGVSTLVVLVARRVRFAE